MFDFQLMFGTIPRLAHGLWLTAFITLSATVIAIILGGWLAFLAMNGGAIWRRCVQIYVTAFRSVPFLILVYLSYFGLPKVGLLVDSLVLGVVALGLYGAAYFSEIARTAFLSVAPGQRQAAQALGLSKTASLRLVEFPQAMVVMVPATTGLTITLLKESAVLSVISVAEATFWSNVLVAETYAFAEVLVVVAFAYWAASTLIHGFGQLLENRLNSWSDRK